MSPLGSPTEKKMRMTVVSEGRIFVRRRGSIPKMPRMRTDEPDEAPRKDGGHRYRPENVAIIMKR
jgi:hypothetical protein